MIIILSRLDLRLHTPMYYFLCHLSFLDLCYTASTVPQLLVNLSGLDRTISFGRCVAQLFIMLSLGGIECVLLVAMAIDRYAAVCRPLHYTTIMHPLLCRALIIFSWVGGLVNSLIQTSLVMAMPLCGHQLNHFFCELPVLLKLACEDTGGTEANLFVARVSRALIIFSWVGGLVNSLIQTSLVMAMPLCGHQLNHFFCELPVLLKLACEDTGGTEANLFVARPSSTGMRLGWGAADRLVQNLAQGYLKLLGLSFCLSLQPSPSTGIRLGWGAAERLVHHLRQHLGQHLQQPLKQHLEQRLKHHLGQHLGQCQGKLLE
ncbi:hypothetical protein A6R68_23850, partial [Neotoma lepida]